MGSITTPSTIFWNKERNMKAVTITKYTTSDGKTFESLEAAQAHELRVFFAPGLEDARITASGIIDKIVADPEGVMVKIEEVMGFTKAADAA